MTCFFCIFTQLGQLAKKQNAFKFHPSRSYSIIFLCLLWVGLVACGNFSQPRSPLATPTSDSLARSPLVMSTPLPTATPTIFVTPKPTLHSPMLTSTPPPNFQVTLDQTKLGVPVNKLIYMTSDYRQNTTDQFISTIWQTNLNDITYPQPVITITHRAHLFPQDLTLSPNNQYLIFGQPYDQLTLEAKLLNLESGDVSTIANDIFLHINAHSFFWSPDNTKIIYTKIPDNWFETSLYQYSLSTAQTHLLLQVDGFIVPIGWQSNNIYYMVENKNNSPKVWKYNTQTSEIEMLSSLEDRQRYIKLSPDGKLALLGGEVWDLENKIQITKTLFFQPLWWPDSQGFIAADDNDPRTKESTISLQRLIKEYTTSLPINTPLNLSLKAPAPLGEVLAWSPDGQYLIYHPPQTTTYHLLHMPTGLDQEFEPATFLTVGGWISE